jgi:outer membrane receptor for ferrienterochelin and colicin
MRVPAFIILFFVFCCSAFAGTTGILEGRVRDKESGEAMVGVIVQIEGTKIGAVTDVDGRFIISNLEAGTYIVKFSQVGYQSVNENNVVVRPDLRTSLEVRLLQSAVQMGEVEVMAERPMIEKDVTSTTFSMGTSQIEKAPLQNLSDLITLFPGVTAEGNVRGGNGTDVVYLIDGIPMQDVVAGGLASSIPKSSITEFSLQTGGFDAEYGNALSGVVNIVTRHGSDNFTVGARLERDNWIANSWNEQQNYMTEGELTLSGPIIPGRMHFFSANTLNMNDTRYWQDMDKFFDSPIDHEISGMSKIDFEPSSKITISVQSIYDLKDWRDYEFSWRFDLGGLPPEEKNSFRNSVILSHTLSDIVHYTLNFSYAYTRSGIGNSPSDITFQPYQYDFFLQYIEDGSEAWYALTDQGIYTTKGDLVIQPNPLNFLKFGFELNLYDISSDVIKLVPQTTYFGEPETNLPELNYSTQYHYYPASGSMYLQDKLQVERDGATVNLGVRWDFLDPRSERPEVEYQPLTAGDSSSLTPTTTAEVPASFKQQLSPRMGLSFPLAWNTVLIMNYGHYFQFPLFDYLYSGTTPQQIKTGVSVLVGNPDLQPERTYSWEIGVKHGFDTKNMVSVTYFNKQYIDEIDSKTLVASTAVAGGDFGYAQYVNNSFASSEGLEVVFTRHRSERLSGSISYTYMTTEGVSDYVNQNINLAQWGFPVANTPYPLSWDQKHTIKLEVDAELPGDVSSNFVYTFATGKPYTYYPTKDGFTPEDPTLPFIPNNARLPSTSTLNARFSHKVLVGGSTSFVLYGNIYNLFDALNAKWADANGRIGGQLGDPSAYYDPRRVIIGVKYDM